MAFKFFAVAALVTIIRGEVVGAKAALPAPAPPRISDATYDPLPQYYFGYNVQDVATGDSKSHIESRNGDVVLGQYSFNDPDGTRRIVDYTSDALNGFNAIVRKVPLALVAPVAARVAAAPVVEAVVTKVKAAKTEIPPANVESAPLAKTVPAPVVVKAEAAPIVADSAAPKSAPVVAKGAGEKPAAALTAAKSLVAALAPVAYAAPVIGYSGFVAPLAVTFW